MVNNNVEEKKPQTVGCIFNEIARSPARVMDKAYVSESEIWGGCELVSVQLVVIPDCERLQESRSRHSPWIEWMR